jgi:hypothetical protein
MEYSVYSDESYISAERYRSIGALSFPRSFEKEIKSGLNSILTSSDIVEFKWQKLKNAKYRFCAEKIARFICKNLVDKQLRIDVIIWDTQDCRHSIEGRDDIANFERMFFHLMKYLMRQRGKNSKWHIFPDERLGIDWGTIQDCLSNVGQWRQYFKSQLFSDAFSEQFFHIVQFDQVDSKNEPGCQVADFFAGLSVFSKNFYYKYKQWCEQGTNQIYLFDSPEDVKVSNKERERFYVLKLLMDNCKKQKLGVSIDTNKCLNTPNPINPINFWHYTPQHSYDRAPLRDKSSLF